MSHSALIVGGAVGNTRIGTPRTSISVIANGEPSAVSSRQAAS
jgi:hypothetical protein